MQRGAQNGESSRKELRIPPVKGHADPGDRCQDLGYAPLNQIRGTCNSPTRPGSWGANVRTRQCGGGRASQPAHAPQSGAQQEKQKWRHGSSQAEEGRQQSVSECGC